ncbi:protein adenylyltransferase SelO [Thorsellia anophelis]|uniref:Protein nucleotidyltransferase YdiU n=1 Tax=Thorsellia anophelis DSM 18579 TaxID=1123402 RepID=A0A1I0D346_9GAMM|nr:YdiU family protein [Thorsellia anophelis]SET26188.1 Uncharacterized conserved protein YdiU, UPF0061 family [Thorsellia anophelis DSM 18579]
MKNSFGFNFDNTYVNLPELLYTEIAPLKVISPKLVMFNHQLASELGLRLNESADVIAKMFSGNVLPLGAQPLSQAYAGHQFGNFAILGDGRAHLLGEHVKADGTRLDIQLKGSGLSPYSRRGDGRAALGPMLREYLISEAMNALNIPTTRSLAVVTTGENVYRTTLLPGAILTRIASSHLRVGTFEFAAFRQDRSLIQSLLEYSINRHYPDLIDVANPALAFFEAVMIRQIDLIVNWMRVGFIHGVMNTDNMTISGETIDYGPCAFIDDYHPKKVFSSIDDSGRYAFGNQPAIAQWNLVRLAESLLPLIESDRDKSIELATDSLNKFSSYYHNQWHTMMKQKLGLYGDHQDDDKLIEHLLTWMSTNKADYTNTFLELMESLNPDSLGINGFTQLSQDNEFMTWFVEWKKRVALNSITIEQTIEWMKQSNPVIIPRNHQVEIALEAAYLGNMTPFERLLESLREPYQQSDKIVPYQMPPEGNDQSYRTYCGT